MIQSIIEKYKDRIAVGTKDFINITWIEQTEKKLGFPLPDSYKEMLLNYEFITVCGVDFKTIAPPEFLHTKNGILIEFLNCPNLYSQI